MISPEAKRMDEVIRRMTIVSRDYDGTITCKCGASHTWSWPDKAFLDWVDEHAPHVS